MDDFLGVGCSEDADAPTADRASAQQPPRDLLPIQLLLLTSACVKDFAEFSFAADTAQAIHFGRAFRFAALKDVWWNSVPLQDQRDLNQSAYGTAERTPKATVTTPKGPSQTARSAPRTSSAKVQSKAADRPAFYVGTLLISQAGDLARDLALACIVVPRPQVWRRGASRTSGSGPLRPARPARSASSPSCCGAA